MTSHPRERHIELEHARTEGERRKRIDEEREWKSVSRRESERDKQARLRKDIKWLSRPLGKPGEVSDPPPDAVDVLRREPVIRR